MDNSFLTMLNIVLAFISILLGFISVYIAIKISKKATNIEQRADNREIEDTNRKAELLDEDQIDDIELLNVTKLITQQKGRKLTASDYYLLGLNKYKNGKFKDAENYFNKAIELRKEKYPAALFYLGHTYLKQNKKEQAKECFTKATELGHKNAKKRLKLLMKELDKSN